MKLLLKEIKDRYIQENFKRINNFVDSLNSKLDDTLIDLAVGANSVLTGVKCEPSVFIGAAVRMLPSGTAKNALATSLGLSNVIGVVESKTSSTRCNIRVAGITLNVYSGLDVTKEYFLSSTEPGVITTVPPTGTGQVVLRIGQPYSSTELLVTKGLRMVRA